MNLHRPDSGSVQDVCPKTLRKLVEYNPETGSLTWRSRGVEYFSSQKGPEKRCAWWNRTFAGKPAITCVNESGYLCGSILNCRVQAHRLCWAVFHGEHPSKVIDHINGNPRDNRISNLRDVSQRTNSKNSSLRSDNKSGVSGIWEKKPKSWGARWQVTIGRDGGIVYTKAHKCIGLAIKDRNAQYAARGFTKDHGVRQ